MGMYCRLRGGNRESGGEDDDGTLLVIGVV